MHVALRLTYALIAAAVVPSLALAQSSLLGNNATDASASASQLASAAIITPIGPTAQQGNASDLGVVALPAPSLETDPIPTAVGGSPQNGGPTLVAATAGIHSHAATEGLTRRQLADRATNRDQDGGRQGLGRDAALMIIGGAGIVVGALVGGTAGTALIVVGAVIGITGLVLILS
jgi:hypothetical protein